MQTPAVRTILPGFADPVADAQYGFRAALDALARPATPRSFAPSLDAPFAPEMASLALSLLDFEVGFWLAPSLEYEPAIAHYLRFHTGSRQVPNPSAASFAFLDLSAGDGLDLAAFAQGTAEYPDRSTTVVVACDGFLPLPGLLVEGPGIKGRLPFGFSPMPEDFIAQWACNREGFPLGVDLLLVASGSLMGLPRSTRILSGG
ncbi:MAG TPA: phosphonate C-P lyase system protein PhnH [Rhabdaerophilum sp.]|nr:phosphonate C-P lyase system protein PhnH [Rhabdaerophilum sp.]